MRGTDLASLLAVVLAVLASAALSWRAATARPGQGWRVVPPEPVTSAAPDSRLRALERILAGHLESREASGTLAGQLERLADRRLMITHGIRIEAAPERAAELLGEEVVTLLRAQPARRMSLRQVELVLRRIEEL